VVRKWPGELDWERSISSGTTRRSPGTARLYRGKDSSLELRVNRSMLEGKVQSSGWLQSQDKRVHAIIQSPDSLRSLRFGYYSFYGMPAYHMMWCKSKSEENSCAIKGNAKLLS
jgi:hypothetical protein